MAPTLPSSNDPKALNPERETYLLSLQTRQNELQSTLSALISQRNSLVVSSMAAVNLEDDQSIASMGEKDEIMIEKTDNLATPTETQVSEALVSANATIKKHITLLNRYNEIKDVGQGLIGMIAEQRGVRVVEVNPEFGIDEHD